VFIDALLNLWESSGLANMDWRNLVMICLSFLLIYLAIGKKFEPLTYCFRHAIKQSSYS